MENSTGTEKDLCAEVCITCLTKAECENIFILNVENTRFSYIFNSCMELKLNEDSELKHMCFECIKMVISFYIFRKSALKSYEELKNVYTKREDVDQKLKGNNKADILNSVSQKHEPLVCNLLNDITESNTIEIVRIEDDNLVETIKLESKVEFENFEEEIHKIEYKKEEDSLDEIKETNSKNGVTKRVIKNNKFWYCSYCPLSFAKKDVIEIKKHRYMEKQKRLKVHPCPHCNKRFTTHKLKEHVLRHGPVKPMKCELCGKRVSSVFTLKKHMMLHEGKRFSCDICGKGFTEQFLLKVHMNGHENPEKKYLCSTCGVALSSPLQLSRHKYEHRRKTKELNEPSQIVCNVCGKLFTRQGTLEVHIASAHSKEDLYECARCGKKFGHRSRLTTHMWYHMTKYRCHACFKIYQHDDLRTHDCKPLPNGTVFADYLPNECKQCGEILRRGDLARHLKKHEKRECKICGEVLYGSKKMMFHRNKHLFRCDLCKKGFTKKTSLILHTANKVCERKMVFF